MLEQVAQRGCGDTVNPAGHSPVQPTPSDSALSQGG